MKSRDLRPYAGHLVLAAGILHCVVGGILYADPLGEIVKAGVVDGVGTDTARDGALWFMYCGLFLIPLGLLIRWTQAQTGTIPASLGWIMLAAAILGAILMPVSGFWLMILLGWLLIAAARQPAARSA